MTQPQKATAEAATSRPAAVYRLYDADDVLLYIGSAFDPAERCKAHVRQSWWPKVARRADEWFPHRRAAYVAEMNAIASEDAKYNRMGSPSYAAPESEAVQLRKELAPLRQQLLAQSYEVGADAKERARADGASSADSERAGLIAAADFLEETGLFAASVKERRRRIASCFP